MNGSFTYFLAMNVCTNYMVDFFAQENKLFLGGAKYKKKKYTLFLRINK